MTMLVWPVLAVLTLLVLCCAGVLIETPERDGSLPSPVSKVLPVCFVFATRLLPAGRCTDRYLIGVPVAIRSLVRCPEPALSTHGALTAPSVSTHGGFRGPSSAGCPAIPRQGKPKGKPYPGSPARCFMHVHRLEGGRGISPRTMPGQAGIYSTAALRPSPCARGPPQVTGLSNVADLPHSVKAARCREPKALRSHFPRRCPPSTRPCPPR